MKNRKIILVCVGIIIFLGLIVLGCHLYEKRNASQEIVWANEETMGHVRIYTNSTEAQVLPSVLSSFFGVGGRYRYENEGALLLVEYDSCTYAFDVVDDTLIFNMEQSINGTEIEDGTVFVRTRITAAREKAFDCFNP